MKISYADITTSKIIYNYTTEFWTLKQITATSLVSTVTNCCTRMCHACGTKTKN
jgi:hypothetical protein